LAHISAVASSMLVTIMLMFSVQDFSLVLIDLFLN